MHLLHGAERTTTLNIPVRCLAPALLLVPLPCQVEPIVSTAACDTVGALYRYAAVPGSFTLDSCPRSGVH